MTTPADFVYTTYIKSTPEKVWQAITTPEFTRQYWGGGANISDWKKGAKWQHEGADNNVFMAGEVLESAPPKRLVISWFDPQDKADVSTVSFDIAMAGGLVKLDVVHGKFKPGSTMAGKVSGGWPLVLASLKSLLETGKGIDIFAVKAPCGGAGGKEEAA